MAKDPKIKEFNYKILHGICLLVCSCNRNKWRLLDTDLCDVWGEVETIEHLLFQCRHAQIYWHLFEIKWQRIRK